MHINYENKTACLGFLDYLLYSLPLTGMEQISFYIAQLNAILSSQAQTYPDDKLCQINTIYLNLDLTNTDESLPFIQKIHKRIQELSEINAEILEETLKSEANFHVASEIVANEFKDCLAKDHPEPANCISHRWYVERAAHFLVGLIHRDSPYVLDSVFTVLPEVFPDLQYKTIFENITNLYVKFNDVTELQITYLFDLPADKRRLVLSNAKELKALAVLAKTHFIEYFKMDITQLEHIIQNLPVFRRINVKLRCPLNVFLSLLPDQLSHIEQYLAVYEKLLLGVQGVSMEEILSMSPDEVRCVNKHLYQVNVLLKQQYALSKILLLTDDELNFIYSYQRDYKIFFTKYAKNPLISHFSNEQLMLIPKYLAFANLLDFSLEEVLAYDVKKIKLVYDHFQFFEHLNRKTSINIHELLKRDEEKILRMMNIKTVFVRLHKNGMLFDDIAAHADSHFAIFEKNSDAIGKWTDFQLNDVYMLLKLSVEDLSLLCSQRFIVDQLLGHRKLTLQQIIAIPANERVEIVDSLHIYSYLLKASPSSTLHDLLSLPKQVRNDLSKNNYQYYRMLMAGFKIEDLCPLFRVFYHEMLDFCEHITNMKVLKAMDEKRFFIVMFYSNAFKDYIANGHLTFEQLTTLSPELLEELAKNCYNFHRILKISELTLEEFLTIDPVFRVKLAIHAGPYENILRNLKLFIRIAPDLQSEVYEHRHAYGRLLLQPTVKLEQLLGLPSAIRHEILLHSTVFARIIPMLPMPFDEFVMSRQENLVEYATFLAENQVCLFDVMDFTFEDIMSYSLDECRQIVDKTEFYISISSEFNCSIRDFYMLHPEQQRRLLAYQPELIECMRNHHFSFNDILILDKRAGGQFCENVNIVLQNICDGRLAKEDLLKMDSVELNDSLNSKFLKKPRLCCPSFF